MQPQSYPPGAGRPDENSTEQYGRPSSGWDSSTWPAEPVTVRRTRSWAVALAALLTGLVLMAAIGNTSVTDSIRKHITGHSFKDGVLFSINSVQWRFGAATGDTSRVWVQHLVGDIAALVLIFLLVWVVANGRGSFWQAFFGTWACSITAFMVASYAGTAVLNQSDEQSSKAVLVFFGPTTSQPTTLFGSLMYGFVIALVAGLVAMSTRQREEMVDAAAESPRAPGYYLAGQQQPQEGAGYPPVPGPVSAPSPWSGGDHPTESLPRTEDQDSGPNSTAVLPPVKGTDRPAGPPYGTAPAGQYGSPYPARQPSGEPPAAEAPDDEQHTTQLPATEEPSTEEPSSEEPGRAAEPSRDEPGSDSGETDTGTWPPPRRDG